MTKLDTKLISKLRKETGAPVVRVKQVLDEVGGDIKKAEKILKKEGFEKMEKRTDRKTSQGKIYSYVHHSGKVAGLIELLCETDFVARNELFEQLGKDLAMQVASMNAKNTKDLEGQDYIKDPSKKIKDLVKEVMAKTGENIRIGRIFHIELGK